jgi:hypothetical protein
MYELRDPSMAQRVVFGAITGALVALAWWLLFGGNSKPPAAGS